MTLNFDAAGSEDDFEGARTLRMFCYFGISIATIALLALAASQAQGFTAAIGIGALIVLSSGAVGSVLGFLFALPRILSKDPKDEPASAAAASGEVEKKR